MPTQSLTSVLLRAGRKHKGYTRGRPDKGTGSRDLEITAGHPAVEEMGEPELSRRNLRHRSPRPQLSPL